MHSDQHALESSDFALSVTTIDFSLIFKIISTFYGTEMTTSKLYIRPVLNVESLLGNYTHMLQL